MPYHVDITPDLGSWQEAGLFDEEGRWARPLDTPGWQVPAVVELDGAGERLRYRWTDDADKPSLRVAVPGQQLLVGFAGLSSALPDRIRDYARSHGVLGICGEHGLPATHSRHVKYSWEVSPLDDDGCEPRRVGPGSEDRFWFWEPVQTWRLYAGLACGVLNVGAALRRGERGQANDWDAIVVGLRADSAGYAESSLADQKKRIELIMEWWLTIGRVAPRFAWPGDYPSNIIYASSLFGALGFELARALVAEFGLASCDGCGILYTPPRRPSPGSRNFCPDCRKAKVPKRAASADWRARARAKRVQQ